MIKVTVDKTKHRATQKYPCLKIANDGELVLFNRESCGVALNNYTDVCGEYYSHRMGYYTTSWDMSCFKPFYGSVTITETVE